MIAKTFEIRDVMTFIPVLAIWLKPGNAADEYLLARQGYEKDFQGEYVLLVWLARSKAEYDPNAWNSRTLEVAHKYIIENFVSLESGDVVDVEFILGVSKSPKKSERIEHPLPEGA